MPKTNYALKLLNKRTDNLIEAFQELLLLRVKFFKELDKVMYYLKDSNIKFLEYVEIKKKYLKESEQK